MAEEKVKKILFSAIERQPRLIFSVIEEEEHPVIQRGQSSVPSWCVCGKCREMVELIEQVCCKRRPEDCISILPVSFISLNVEVESVNITAWLYHIPSKHH